MALRDGQLTRVDIKGFKSIRESNILLGPINVLIGSNGAGKSNFISVFTLLAEILRQNLSVYAAQSGIPSLFYNGIKETDEIEICFHFGNNGYGFVLVPTDDHRIIFKKEYFRYHGNFDNESNIGRGHQESQWEQGASNGIDNYVQPILARESWRVYHFHDTGSKARVKQTCNVASNDVLQRDAGNLSAFLYRLREVFPQNYRNILNAVRSIAPFFDDFELKPNETNPELIALKWRKRGCDDIFMASQLSDGTLRFICMATLLLQPEELQPATIIIDEPELGLHPYAITIFSELVHAAAQNKQLILSTQSVELLNQFDAEDVIVVEGGENGTEFKRLDPDALQIWLDEDYSLGDLWNKNLLGGRV